MFVRSQKLWQVEATGQPDASGCAHTFSMVATMMQLDLAIQKLWQVEATGQPDASGCALLTHMAWMVATMMQLSVSRKYYGKLRQPGNLMQVDVRCSHT